MKKSILHLPPGTYIVAVSGGVDSMALLDMMCKLPYVQVIVAHANHGLRSDASDDQEVVACAARKYGVVFEVANLHLPSCASEAAARQARYSFLQQCREKHNANAIVTAHHQDDLIETAILNIVRGTGWRGIAPFVGQTVVVRPLLEWRKDELIGYARKQAIEWREDSTNTDETFTRNYIRHTLMTTLDQKSPTWRQSLLRLIRSQQTVRGEIEQMLQEVGPRNATVLHRYELIMNDTSVASELLRHTVRSVSGQTLTRPLAAQVLQFAKVAKTGKSHPLSEKWRLRVTKREVIVEPNPLVVS